MVASAFFGPLRRISSEIGLFFQDSYGSLNPRMMAGAKLVVIAMWRDEWRFRLFFGAGCWLWWGEMSKAGGGIGRKKGLQRRFRGLLEILMKLRIGCC